MIDQNTNARIMKLPSQALDNLADAMEHGSLRHGVSAGLIAPFAGDRTADVVAFLQAMKDEGTTARGFAVFFHCLAIAKREAERASDDAYLTLSGPPVAGSPVISTPTVVRGLFAEAQQDVIVTSYVFNDAKALLAPLVDRYRESSGFRVRFILDLSHQRKTKEEPLPVVANRFRTEFLKNFWAADIRAPEFWHDPRVFEEKERTNAGVMHAKTVVIDNTSALVTSANFTTAAQERNIEAGVLIRNPHQVQRLRNYFEGLMSTRRLRELI